MYQRDVASQRLGIDVDELAQGCATASMTVTADMLNGHGIVHGGYIFLLADTAFALACNTHGAPTVARGCEIAFLRPVAAGERLIARAQKRTRSRRSGIYDVSVATPDGRAIAELRGHSATINPKDAT